MFSTKNWVIGTVLILIVFSVVIPVEAKQDVHYDWNILAENSRNWYGNTNIFTEISRTRYTFQEVRERYGEEEYNKYGSFYLTLNNKDKQRLIDEVITHLFTEDTS